MIIQLVHPNNMEASMRKILNIMIAIIGATSLERKLDDVGQQVAGRVI